MNPQRATNQARTAVVLARHRAVPPPGVDADAFAAAALADTYEVLADLVDVTAGVAGGDPDRIAALLWPGSLQLPDGTPQEVVGQLPTGHAVVVAADAPDLPGLVLAKLFRALIRAEVAVAPARGEPDRAVAVGVRVPWPAWVPDLDLDRLDLETLRGEAPSRGALAVGPDWHRLTAPAATDRLDPGLEGWDSLRSLLGRP